MNGRTLLLDFDGVLYSNKFAHRVIAERSTRYCNKFIKSHNVAFVDNLHRHLYKTHGHTVIGLQKLGYNAHLNEYNKDVFSNLDFMGMDNEFENIKEVNDTITYLKSHGINTYVFSNAPSSWTVPLMKQMKLNIPEHNVLDILALKPMEETYHNIEYIFGDNHLIFVDDNMINFMPIIDRCNWTKILFAPDANMSLRDDLYVIDNIKHIKNIVLTN